MKREIKFRAWDEGNKVMHFDFQFVKTGDDGNDWILFTSDKQPKFPINEWSANPYFSQQLKIMQYTGLKDKLGKEIYEGDIIQRIIYCKSGDNIVVNSQVEFNNLTAMFTTKVDSEYNDQILSDYAWEIVGNIYENPELL